MFFQSSISIKISLYLFQLSSIIKEISSEGLKNLILKELRV